MSDIVTVVNIVPKLSSGETNGDSEANLAVNPENPLEMAATTFTPSPNIGSPNSPVFYSTDGGSTWSLRDFIGGRPVRDQTLRFATQGGTLYGGVLLGPGAFSTLNFDILRTHNFSGLAQMQVLAQRKNDDQPFIEAATVPSGPFAGKDRIYIGSNDHAPSNVPATVDLSLDARAVVPAISTIRLEQRTVLRDGFPTRPAVHPSGIIYAIYYALIGPTCDVVVVRDDNWASGATPFLALIDTDGKEGIRVAQGVTNPFNSISLGQQRIGSDLAIAVDPNNSATVYICYGDLEAGTYTLDVRKSVDSGATWLPAIRNVANATNPALAINSGGRLGFLYQQVTGSAPNQKWQTTLEFTDNDFAAITTYILANAPAATPPFAGNPYLGDYLSMMAVGTGFYGIFTANNTPDHANFPNGVSYQRNADFATKTLLDLSNNPVRISIDPFVFKVLPGVGRVVTAIADAGNFGRICLGSFADEELTIDNGGSGELTITNIVAAPADFQSPGVLSYPIKLGVGDSIDIPIRFAPNSLGPKAGTITIFSNDPASPHIVKVSGDAPAPRLSLAIANHGNFGKVCVGSFTDELLTLNNSGQCPLTVLATTSTPGPFLVPEVLSYPLLIGPGDSLAVPIRFAPTGFGAATATLTVMSTDPNGPLTVKVSGDTPAGQLAIGGSSTFGGVTACCCADRTLSICNVGDCTLDVTGVRFKRKSRHWRLLNNPFPAKLAPGSCLPVVIQYHATEKCPRSCELLIGSDDPTTPVKVIEVLAYTVWDSNGKHNCDECGEGCCAKPSCHQGYPCCCDDDEDEDGGS